MKKILLWLFCVISLWLINFWFCEYCYDYDAEWLLLSCASDLNGCTSWQNLSWENWSALYINDIQYDSSSIIDITIPDEFDWYYTWSIESGFFVVVKGLNGDSDYIQSIIDINSYRPTSEEFTDTFVSGLSLLMPYFVIILFVVFLRKLIKKIFKS